MKTRLLFILFIVGIFSLYAQTLKVDYRYAPQWHASTTSLPDDTCKTVVGPLGQLLYEFGSDKFYPYANNKGFRTVVHVLADENVKINDQKLYSPRVPIVVTESSYAGMEIIQEAFATGLDYIQKGISTKKGNREDIVLTTVENKTNTLKTINPVLIINSEHEVKVEGRVVTINNKEQLVVSEEIVKVRKVLSDSKTFLELASIQMAAGEKRQMVVLYDNGKQSLLANELKADAKSLNNKINTIKEEHISYWENKTEIPYGHISVPDQEIQNILDASIRGIWQAREIKDGNISFQVGPTCYRGLWITDGAFFLETATMLDKGKDARYGIDYTLSFQQENGKFGKMTPNYWKENGIVLWTCVRHAMLTQDKEWLRSIWPKLRKTVAYIKELRKTTLDNDIPLDDGLIPPGDIDGGLWGGKDQAEYTNIYWNLSGLKAMIQAANWIGEKKDAKEWDKEYKDFYDTFQAAAHRDMQTDAFGNQYLSVLMDPKFQALPQRAQWAFCQGIYPGQIFEKEDPIAVGTINMLHTTLQEGIVMGTGWMPDGIWSYFASFYGHACLWMGDSKSAYESLYAFANHASPLYAWREEQNPRDLEPKFWGEMPHNWGSAEFVRLTVHLLALDRGNEMHLLEGLPAEWLQAGMETSLKDIATPFGKLSFTLKVNEAGNEANLTIDKLTDSSCIGIYVHLGEWAKNKESNTIKLNPSKSNSLTIALR
ncbi:hypothetical protein [Dysgonomonas sp. ZJ279]|uniref:alpha-L-rhamnosidase-related protein n=1 Tax=Dysgonomonas sp. ZJ279 TaxID=2709796 RepID=UPI0013EBE326|nr:hypothetical protein [Dysgonomonas sp. ZJ279]